MWINILVIVIMFFIYYLNLRQFKQLTGQINILKRLFKSNLEADQTRVVMNIQHLNELKKSEIKGIKKEIKNKAFTVVEILIVVAIINLTAVIAIPNYLKARDRAYYAKTSADMRILQSALMDYCQYMGDFPVVLNSLVTEPIGEAWAFTNMVPTDWFGYDYVYEQLESVYSLKSRGLDGVLGTNDDIEVW